ncbi:MAG TPA: PDZ domain-containing protein [Pyrinomonadaceae bacterium]|nr:PDZ domain-containing protein [Pyrinomonadaceae bacterium]
MPGFRHYKRLRWLYLALAVLEVLVIELPGVRDYALSPYAGYELGAESSNDFNSDFLIPRIIERVRPGSPAERAGFRPGDLTLSVAGIPYEDQKRIIELGRPGIGETRSIAVQRGGERLLLQLTYESNPGSYDLKYSGFAVIAFAFLIAGTICFWFYPGPTTSLLFWLGFTGAFVFMHKPYLNSFPARSAFAMMRWFITSLWLALLLHFLLIFPKPKRILASWPLLARFSLYLPCLLLFLIIAYFTAFPSRLTGGGEFVLNIAFIFIAAYLVLAVGAFIHTYLTMLKSERTRGMKIMAFGTAIGILPIAVSIVMLILAPRIKLPLRDYYILTLVLVPVCFAIGVLERLSDGQQRPATS